MIDAVASWAHLVDHLAPIWRALPEDERGTFYVGKRTLVEHAASRGVRATVGYPHDPGPPTLVANYHDLTQTHIRRRVAYLEHGAGQTYAGDFAAHPSYSGGTDRQRVALFLTLNETTAERERAAYPDSAVVVVGSPHLDELAAVIPVAPEERRVAFAFHWDCHLVDETRETFRYWRRAVHDLAAAGTPVLGHSHPRIADTLERHFVRWGVPFTRDLEVVIARASVLCFDNTSAGYEAAALGVPVVALNSPRYRRDVEHGLRFWDLIPGPQADDPHELVEAIAEAPGPEWSDRRREVSARVYPPVTRGRAADLAVAAVREHLAR